MLNGKRKAQSDAPISTTQLPLLEEESFADDFDEEDSSMGENGNTKGGREKAKNRHDNSLSVLTKRFVQLIQKSPNQTIDLNDTVKSLDVQKRRIYDITNVLEGIGYIEKIHKNKIKWVGGTEDPELQQEISSMQAELKELEEQEKKMDYWIKTLHGQLKDTFNNSEEAQKYAYLTHEDFKNLCKISQAETGETMFIITAPKGTTVEAPLLEEDIQYEYPFQLYLNSKSGEMEVFLCSDENEGQEVKETKQSQKEMRIPGEDQPVKVNGVQQNYNTGMKEEDRQNIKQEKASEPTMNEEEDAAATVDAVSTKKRMTKQQTTRRQQRQEEDANKSKQTSGNAKQF